MTERGCVVRNHTGNVLDWQLRRTARRPTCAYIWKRPDFEDHLDYRNRRAHRANHRRYTNPCNTQWCETSGCAYIIYSRTGQSAFRELKAASEESKDLPCLPLASRASNAALTMTDRTAAQTDTIWYQNAAFGVPCALIPSLQKAWYSSLL